MEAIEKQNFPMENLGFVFELGPEDEATHEMLWNWNLAHPEFLMFDGQVRLDVRHMSHNEGQRQWTAEKYFTMVDLRNSLLNRATEASDTFDFYFSLDSDLLIEDPNTLSKLVEYASQGRDVISPLSYMTPYGNNYPSVMSWVDYPGGRATRKIDTYPIGEIFKADIVMAAVFMAKPVYTTVRYRHHKQGEDLGFAAELTRHNFSSYCASDIYCNHVMHKRNLAEYIKDGFDVRKPV